MKVAVHQCNFLPWLGFFDKLAKSDLFVILDDAQVSVEGFVTRNKIRVPRGSTWISVPVESRMGNINEVRPFISEAWVSEVRKKIDRSYGDKKLAERMLFKYGFYGLLYEAESLAEFNTRIIKHLCMMADIKTPLLFSSDLNVGGSSYERIINICNEVGADVYLSGIGGHNYINPKRFEAEGIKVEYQEFKHPIYDQMYPGFEPYMSALDKLLCTGELL